MTDREKLEKIKELANAMYYAAQYLTTDASMLHKAMDEYHKFIILEYHNRKEEDVNNGLDLGCGVIWKEEEPKECVYSKGNYTNADRLTLCKDCEETCIYNQKSAAESHGISQEEYEEIIDKCLFGAEPELVDLGDIPFGARDSELEEATYYIPDGYHAVIDGDKVIIRKR